MLRKVLVVEDNEMNRRVLHNILEKSYEVFEAENGKIALEILHKKHKVISAVLLDISMPVMDGFEVLKDMRSNAVLSQIPVIIATGSEEVETEVKALSLGANDYITKPYNPALILHCLRNTINLRETASIVNAITRDKLTGLFNREAFFDKVETLLEDSKPGYYIMSCFDIDNFKMINDQYGALEGDRILKHIGKVAKETFETAGGICSRISADNFAALYPAEDKEIDFITRKMNSEFTPPDTHATVVYSVGRCVITDLTLSASAIYDRSYIAKQSVKGRYDEHIAYFSESMREKLVREQEIIGDMDAALMLKQFEIWLQPQFNHSTGAVIGAEALVRWHHPRRGVVDPGKFIPVFEQNGFIYELDKYVWEQCCRLLRKWIDEGRSPLPLSVNISRYDIFKTDLMDVIMGLVDKYYVPVHLLRFEITESAFAKSSKQIINVVKRLIDLGFTVEIDDFGSGYSSLNTLKDVPANVLKLDMRFLENDNNSQRGGNILESVIRMAKWLSMSVIAEGVETTAQANYLKSIGCNYVQGYLYAKPMSVEDYEALADDIGREEKMSTLETVENMNNSSFWDPKSMDTLIFNSYVGGACIFEYHNGVIELLRANDKYAQVIGSSGMTVEEALKLNWAEHLDENSRKSVIGALERSVKTGDEVTEEYVFLNLPNCPKKTYLRSTMRVIASAGERHLVYCTNENMTAQRQAEQKEGETSSQMRAIMNNINGGVTATVIRDEEPQLLFANRQFYKQLGYTKKQFEKEVGNPHKLVHPDDRKKVEELTKRASETHRSFTVIYRVLCRNNTIKWIQSNVSVTNFDYVKEPVQLAVANDITELRMAEEKERRASEQVQAIMDEAGSGITASILRNEKVEFLLANDKYYELLGYTRRQYEKEVKDVYGIIHAEDRERVFEISQQAYKEKKPANVEYRVIRRDGALCWLRAMISSTKLSGIDQPVQLCVFTDITAEKNSERELRETDEQLRFLNSAAHKLLAQNDSKKAVEAVLQKVLDYFGGNRAYIFEFDYEKKIVNNTYEVCIEGISKEIENLQNVPFDVIPFWIHAFDRKNYINIENVEALGESRPEKAILKAQKINSLIAVPIKWDGKLVGFIGVDDPSHKQDCVERLEAIGDYIAVILLRRDLDSKISSDNEMLAGLMRDIPGGFVRMRVCQGGTIVPVYFNDGFCQLVGMNRAQLMTIYGKDAMAGIHPDDIHIVREAVNKMLTAGEARSSRYRLLHNSGKYIWLVIFGRMTKEKTGEIFLNIYYIDASEQTKLEEHRNELLNNLSCGAALYDFDGEKLSVVYLNERYRKLVGRGESEKDKISTLEFVHPDDREGIIADIKLAIREKRDVERDVRIMYGKEKNAYRTFHTASRVVPKGEGKYADYVAYIPMIEEEVAYREMLPVALTTVMESAAELSFVKDRKCRYICCSRAFARVAGLDDKSSIVGKTDYDLVNDELAEWYGMIDRKIIETGKAQINYDEILPDIDGNVRYANTSKYPLLDSKGNVIGIYGVTRDITEVHETNSQLKLLADNIPGGIVTAECSENSVKVTYFNDGFCELFGYTREEYEKQSKADPVGRVFKEDLPAFWMKVKEIVKNNEPAECIYRIHIKGGGYRWVDHRAVVVRKNGDTVVINAVVFDVTEQQEATELLRMSEEEYRLAIQHSGRVICRYSIEDRALLMSPETSKIMSMPSKMKDVPYEPVRLGLVSTDSVSSYIAFYESILSGNKSGKSTFQIKTAEGWRWMEAHFSTIFADTGKPVSAVVSFNDITERLEKEAVYKKWQQSLKEKKPESYTLFRCNLSKDVSYDSVEGDLIHVVFDDEEFTFNERTMKYVSQCVYEEDKERYLEVMNSDALLANYYRGKRTEVLEYREKQADGIRWLQLSVDLVEYPNSGDVEAYLMYENIDDSKRAETDPLTGVLNRTAFIAQFKHLIHTSKKDVKHSLIMLDIDGFKLVNDVFGHGAGDQALIDIAGALSSVLRKGDLLGRLGGDEFVILLQDVPNSTIAAKKAKQICALTRKSFSVDVRVSCSIGIVMFPNDGDNFETLYKKVDVALYHVKSIGKDNYAFYQNDMGDEHLQIDKSYDNTESFMKEKKRRMLIVEDSKTDYNMLSNMFKNEFNIEWAKDGASALIRMRHYGSAISVVLLDLMMPGMDGFAVLKKMQNSSELQTIPVVVVSSADDREASLKVIKNGASDFVTKPVDPDILRIRVQSAISKSENERLRAQNSFLELQNEEIEKYKTVFESTGMAIVEHDWVNGTFYYDPNISTIIAGDWDDRSLWHILLSDMVSDVMTVRKMQELVHKVAEDRDCLNENIEVVLKIPSGEKHLFRMDVYKRADEYKLTDKLSITFKDINGKKI